MKVLTWAGLAVVGVALLGGGVWYYLEHRDDPPSVEDVDVDAQGVGAKLDWVRGEAWVRPARPEEYEFNPAGNEAETAKALSGEKTPVFPGSYFRVAAQAALQMSTYGNFIVGLDGPGEFLFENAKRDAKGLRHVLVFRLLGGRLRAKRHDYDSTEHWLEVHTKKGRIVLKQGELGVEVNDQGGGRFWIVSGEAVYRTESGERRDGLKKGVYPL